MAWIGDPSGTYPWLSMDSRYWTLRLHFPRFPRFLCCFPCLFANRFLLCGQHQPREEKKRGGIMCSSVFQWICYSQHQLYSMCTYHRRRIEQYDSMMSMIVTQALPFSIASLLLSSVTGCKKGRKKNFPRRESNPDRQGESLLS